MKHERTTPVSPSRNSHQPHLRRGLLLIVLALTCFALSPPGRAQDASETDAFGNAAMEGSGVLSSNTGIHDTGLGFNALFNNTSGSFNTATGSSALASNTTGSDNTANGFSALNSNSTGNDNTAIGFQALLNNTASANTAIGSAALKGNNSGVNNTAEGYQAMFSNKGGFSNTANGFAALYSNTSGNSNVGTGVQALYTNSAGTNNTADGFKALYNATGSNNTALGYQAGISLGSGSNNIDIGNAGKSADANIIRIGTKGTQTSTYIAGISGKTVANGVAVFVNANGQLGTVQSSARFKNDIKPMDKASEAILALKPVTFRYKHELDPSGIPQFGLIAEDVEKVDPDLVVRDDNGKVTTVRYEAVNAMLLNEFLKEYRKVEDLRQANVEQKEQIAELRSTIENLAQQVRKVSPQIATTRAESKLSQK